MGKKKKQVREVQKGGKPGQWSARKTQLAVKKYKDKGGGYAKNSAKSKNTSLGKWTRQRWRTKSGKNSVLGKKQLVKDIYKELSNLYLIKNIKKLLEKKKVLKRVYNIVVNLVKYQKKLENGLSQEKEKLIVRDLVDFLKNNIANASLEVGNINLIETTK